MQQTGSLGIRIFPSLHRYVAQREAKSVTVKINGSLYDASAKISRLGDAIINIKPEFEDCKMIAAKTRLPLKAVMRIVEEEGWKQAET